MKKFYLITIFLFVASLSYSQSGIGITFTKQFEPQSKIDESNIYINDKFSLGITSTLKISPSFSLFYGITYRKEKYTNSILYGFDPSSSFTVKRNLHQIEIPIHLRWYFIKQSKKLNPYLIGGANIGLNMHLDGATYYPNSMHQFNNIDFWDPLKLELGAGLDYKLNENLFLNLQASAKGAVLVNDEINGNMQMGFFYRFKK